MDIMREHNISDPRNEELYPYLISDNEIREALSNRRNSYNNSNSEYAITKLVSKIIEEIERLYNESECIKDLPALSKKIFFSVVFNDDTCYDCNIQFRWSNRNNTIKIENFGFQY